MKIAGALLLLLITVGCQKESFLPVVVGEAGEKVEVSLNFRLQPFSVPENSVKTKSISEGFAVEFDSISDHAVTKTTEGITLHNLYVFQFKADGTLAQQPIHIEQVAASTTDNIVQLPVTLTVGENQTLYLVALGKALTDNLMGITSLGALERYPFTYVDVKNGLNISKIKSEDDVPFAGKENGITIIQFGSENTGLIKYNVPDGFTGGISLRRLVSKVTLNYLFDVKDYSATGVRLKSVPSQFRIKPSSSDNITYVDMEMQKPDPNSPLYNTPSWYIAPNEHGTVESIIIESDRYRLFDDDSGRPMAGNAPKQASYFELWTKATSEYIVYQIYIGNNNTSDFNIESNNYYNINTLINGDITSVLDDNRVRRFSVKHFVDLFCTRHIIGSASTILSGNDIDAHYDFRPIVINTDGRSVTAAIYTDRECRIMASADAWLQISPDPNYTLAKRSNSLSNSTTVNVNVPSKVVLYLYNDEYIPDDISSVKKRTLYVKVVTTTLNVPTDIKSTSIFEMEQIPPVNLGFFGGTLGDTGYQSNLVMDCINEGGFMYVASLPPPLTTISTYAFGYKGINTDAYGTNNAIHGAAATRALAENLNNYTIDPTGAVAQTNGDLYQYNYYNTFPARFCYDMNRDLNGDGVIDDSELKWYLPTINQLLGYWLYNEDSTSPSVYNDNWSVNRSYLTSGFVVKSEKSPIHCVRDVKK